MSEHDDMGGGRKGFVRDVMRRISPTGGRVEDEGEGPGRSEGLRESDVEQLQDAIRFFGSDSKTRATLASPSRHNLGPGPSSTGSSTQGGLGTSCAPSR